MVMEDFKIKKSEIAAQICPTDGNPRNSEGDFIALKDGRIMLPTAATRVKAAATIALRHSLHLLKRRRRALFDPRILAFRPEHNTENIMSVSL